MRLGEKITTAVRCIQRYQNWIDIITLMAKKKSPTKVILRNRMRIEATRDIWLPSLVEEIFFEHVYTPDYLQIERNDVVVDIGANVGVFTVFAASRTQNTVYAFEPFPDSLEILKRNISMNSLNNVIPCGFAVSDKISSATLLLSPIRSTRHLLSDRAILDQLEKYQTDAEHIQFKDIMPMIREEYVEVPTTTLQSIMDINGIEHIDFVKMDCEGSEGLILASTPKNYLKRVRKIAIEFHDHLSKVSHGDLQKLFEETGFVTYLKWDGKSPLGFLYGWRDCVSPRGGADKS